MFLSIVQKKKKLNTNKTFNCSNFFVQSITPLPHTLINGIVLYTTKITIQKNLNNRSALFIFITIQILYYIFIPFVCRSKVKRPRFINTRYSHKSRLNSGGLYPLTIRKSDDLCLETSSSSNVSAHYSTTRHLTRC